jgi:DNA polymerase-3 subunit delta'
LCDIRLGHTKRASGTASVVRTRSVQRGRLSHAYVLAGSDGIGKRKFARLLAQSMFCRERKPDEIDACGECRACRSFIAGTWPDYIEIGLAGW